jgi:hypothetical protein
VPPKGGPGSGIYKVNLRCEICTGQLPDLRIVEEGVCCTACTGRKQVAIKVALTDEDSEEEVEDVETPDQARVKRWQRVAQAAVKQSLRCASIYALCLRIDIGQPVPGMTVLHMLQCCANDAQKSCFDEFTAQNEDCSPCLIHLLTDSPGITLAKGHNSDTCPCVCPGRTLWCSGGRCM